MKSPQAFGVVLVAVLLGLVPLGAGSGEPPPLELSLLSYNTHGLHRWIARDDPERRFPLIGAKARSYDVAVFQEVFLDDYDRRLELDAANGWQGFRGNGPRPGPLGLMQRFCPFCGSGLAAGIGGRLSVASVARVPFGICAGKLRGAHDCWATKGLLAIRLAMPNGAEIDLYDLHLDAGERGADFRARRAQLDVLRRVIAERSPGRAVIVAGDFNLKQDVERDRRLLEAFRADLGLGDALARPSGRQWTEVIDYILHRSGQGARLEVLEAGEAVEMVDDEGAPLSDHPAVWARFRVSP